MRFREDKSADRQRAAQAVAAWREENPDGTPEGLVAAIGGDFHPDYGVVLRALFYQRVALAAPRQPLPGGAR